MSKTYLGDSVYTEISGEHLVLTTENGLPTDPSNCILLDNRTLKSLLEYLEVEKDEQC